MNKNTITLLCSSATERYRRLDRTWCLHFTVEEAAPRCHVPENRNPKIRRREKKKNYILYLSICSTNVLQNKHRYITHSTSTATHWTTRGSEIRL